MIGVLALSAALSGCSNGSDKENRIEYTSDNVGAQKWEV